MTQYRTHNCGQLSAKNAGTEVLIAGWIHRKRDLGNLCFVDLRDHFGITQCVFEKGTEVFEQINSLRVESVIGVRGQVVLRDGNINKQMPTGEIEVIGKSVEVHSSAEVLPIQVFGEDDSPEDLRLKYRFLDLRKEKLHNNIMLRSKVIASMRRLMIDQGFTEFQTPILTASSPEGARDFLVPSRVNPGKFYALPQAPQQFKQLLMVSGFDKYFQIAPCFRDEDPRADRSPGEFYQLDMEMSFATQDDVFNAIEYVMEGVFKEFANGRKVDSAPFIRIPYRESMLKYGCDKPDLRNPLLIADMTELFGSSGFGVYDTKVLEGNKVRAIRVAGIADKPRSFFDKINDFGKESGFGGVAYLGQDKGVFKLLNNVEKFSLQKDEVIFFCVGQGDGLSKFAGKLRTKLGQDLGLIEENAFRFCWINDFPMFEADEQSGKIGFSHNPFSMPQGGMEALLSKNPLDILAYQYDIVCNGIELSSGAVRNHRPEIMYKAFEIAGYDSSVVDNKFGGMINAFKYGAPPHAGCAPGVDRTVMLLADEPSIREVILFPMNGKAQDLMMQAPNKATDAQLKELRIRLVED